MPTAEMQKDKTVMLGGSFLNKNVTPECWNYNTYNYYINVTFLPFIEVSYACTLNKGKPDGYWPEETWGKFTNQDRQFSIRLRIIKENQFWKYMPAIVLGGNDITTRDWQATNNKNENSGFGNPLEEGNGHWSRYYIVLTRHFNFTQIGLFGIHAAYLYNKREEYHINGPAFGGNFRFTILGNNFLQKTLNGLNLMTEYDSRTINTGIGYSFWKDHINFVTELNDFKYLSCGIYFKVHLK